MLSRLASAWLAHFGARRYLRISAATPAGEEVWRLLAAYRSRRLQLIGRTAGYVADIVGLAVRACADWCGVGCMESIHTGCGVFAALFAAAALAVVPPSASIVFNGCTGCTAPQCCDLGIPKSIRHIEAAVGFFDGSSCILCGSVFVPLCCTRNQTLLAASQRSIAESNLLSAIHGGRR